MDFDEIDYLEKMLENPNSLEVNETANGIDGAVKSGENEGSRRSSKHQRDEIGAGFDRRSKRVKPGDEAHDGQRHRERSSVQPRLSSRDGERGEKDRHRSSREHRVQGRYYRDRDQQKEWQRGHNRNRRLQDREREGRGRHHQSEKEKGESVREGEEETEDSRRSGSNPERPRSRDDRDSERIQGGDFKEKEKEKELRDNTNRYARAIFRSSLWLLCQAQELSFQTRRYKDKKESNTELEVDPERDQRTVFAYQISLKADERDAYEFFSRAGKVRDVRLIMDRNSRRSKGVGYVEFYDAMSVPMAIALSGQPLLGQPVMVKPSEAEKNLVQSTAATTGGSSGASGSYSGGGRRLYVGNLHFNITEDQLRQVFESFGTVELVQLPLDQETGHCKGFGFIQFARLEDARAAQSLDGQLDIAGRIIKVSIVTDQAGTQDVGANAADFDDDEGGGMSLNARSRSLLMQKLDRTGTASGFAGSLSNSVVSSAALSLPVAPILGATPMVYPLVASLMQTSVPSATVPTIESVGVPSECLLLKNMFDPSSETEPDFDMDIKEDVVEESKKFGKLKHIHVDKNSAGFVYLQFENTPSAINAQQALHGRWFAGKMITATYMLPQNYEAKFLNM